MTATYNENLLSTLDRVRFRLGDIDVSDPLIPDETITASLSLFMDNEGSAIAYLSQGLVMQFSRDPVKWTADGRQLDYTGRLEVWRALASTSGGAGVSPLTFADTIYETVADTTDEYGQPPYYREPLW